METHKHDSVICKITTRNNTIQYKHVCRSCGASLSKSYSHSTLTKEQKDGACKTTTEEIEQRREAYQKKIQAIPDNVEWKAWYYETYLFSQEWMDKRKRALERDKYLCQGCLEHPASIVHHLTYERVYKGDAQEMMFDLISLCENCHERIHS